VKTFQESTPGVPVGLLVEKGFDYSFFLAQIPNPSIVHVKFYNHHFNWNPTQYKLDLVQFSQNFRTVFWLDSDVVVYRDLSQFLLTFHRSNKLYAFTPDHVNHSSEFRRLWSGNKENMFIPQACFMGFKSDTMKQFFQEWEHIWKEWITPHPFAKYPDPYPSFPNSSFCIEQYALGMTIERLIDNIDLKIFYIPRDQMFVQNIGQALSEVSVNLNNLTLISSHNGTVTANGTNSSYGTSSYRSSYSTSYRPTSYYRSSYYPSSYSTTSYTGSSYGGSYSRSSYYPSSYSTTSYTGSSYSGSYTGSSYTGSSYTGSSYTGSSYTGSSYTGSSYTGSSYTGSSYTGSSYTSSSYTASSYVPSLNQKSFSTSTSTSYAVPELQEFPPSQSNLPNVNDGVMVDNFADGVVHYYSVHYERLFSPEQQHQHHHEHHHHKDHHHKESETEK